MENPRISENIWVSVTILQWCKSFDATLGFWRVLYAHKYSMETAQLRAIAQIEGEAQSTQQFRGLTRECYSCVCSRLGPTLFGLRCSPRVSPAGRIVNSPTDSPTRAHPKDRMAQDQGPATALVTGGRPPPRPGDRARSCASRLARRRPLPRLGGRGLGRGGRDRSRRAVKRPPLPRTSPAWRRLEPLIESCAASLGPITCLINSAACFEWDDIQTLDRDSWQAHLDVNLRAPIFLAQAFARRLPEGAAGNVINIIDQKVLRPDPEFFSYTIAKSALWTATQTLGAGARAADQGQCDRARPGAAEPEAERGGVRARMPLDPARARRRASRRSRPQFASCSRPPRSPAR